MTYTNMPDTGAMSTEGLFPNHGPINAWLTEEGDMLAPHIQMPMESVAMNRGQVESGTRTPGWATEIIVTTGLTRGGGAMAV